MGFSNEIGLQEDRYFDVLARMFEQALKTVATLVDVQREPLWKRLSAGATPVTAPAMVRVRICEDPLAGYGAMNERKRFAPLSHVAASGSRQALNEQQQG